MLAIGNLRKNHQYRIVNFDEELRFTVLEVLENDNYLIKNLTNLEVLELNDILQYGISADYILDEI